MNVIHIRSQHIQLRNQLLLLISLLFVPLCRCHISVLLTIRSKITPKIKHKQMSKSRYSSSRCWTCVFTVVLIIIYKYLYCLFHFYLFIVRYCRVGSRWIQCKRSWIAWQTDHSCASIGVSFVFDRTRAGSTLAVNGHRSGSAAEGRKGQGTRPWPARFKTPPLAHFHSFNFNSRLYVFYLGIRD